MTEPSLSLDVQPMQGGDVVYLPLAPGTMREPAEAQLSLRLLVTNNEPTRVILNRVELDFSPTSAAVSQGFDTNVAIGPGRTDDWMQQRNSHIVLPMPAPTSIDIRLYCGGFSDPAVFSHALAAHVGTAVGPGYSFPARVEDLRPNEFWHGRSAGHSPAGRGVQLYAHDFHVWGYDPRTHEWSALLPRGSRGRNEDYRIWGKPIHAMADGTVVAFLDNEPTNTSPPDRIDPSGPVEGNHFYIAHGGDLMLYAHLQPGSLPAALKSVGATVTRGDFLGRAGNTGNSTGPHLHIHAIVGTKPWDGPTQPIPFIDTRALDLAAQAVFDPWMPWVETNARGLPSKWSLIWPSGEAVRFRGALHFRAPEGSMMAVEHEGDLSLRGLVSAIGPGPPMPGALVVKHDGIQRAWLQRDGALFIAGHTLEGAPPATGPDGLQISHSGGVDFVLHPNGTLATLGRVQSL